MFTQEDIQGMVNETMSQVTNAIADPTQSVFWGSINAGTTILKEFKIDTDMSDVEPELQVSKENQILLWSRIYAYSCIMQSLYLSKASEVTIEDISNMFDNALKGVAFTIGKNASKSPYSPMLHINGTGIICRL